MYSHSQQNKPECLSPLGASWAGSTLQHPHLAAPSAASKMLRPRPASYILNTNHMLTARADNLSTKKKQATADWTYLHYCPLQMPDSRMAYCLQGRDPFCTGINKEICSVALAKGEQAKPCFHKETFFQQHKTEFSLSKAGYVIKIKSSRPGLIRRDKNKIKLIKCACNPHVQRNDC